MARLGKISALVVGLALAVPATAGATFPGANGTIAYTAFPGGLGDSELLLLEPGSNTPLQLTNDSLGQGEPSYSADGRRIVFAQGGPGITAEIWIVRSDGTGAKRITKGHVDAHPAFSPSGRWIVFGRDGGIAKMRSDGTRLRRLTKANGNFLYDYQPTWSPSGKLIAFSSNRINRKSAVTDIWTMRPDGSHKRNLTHTRKVFENFAGFSPKGRAIVFSSDRGSHLSVWRMSSRGRNPHRVKITGAFSEKGQPTFSPDGRRIAFISADEFGNKNGLFTAPATGGPAKLRGSAGELPGGPTWQSR